MAYWIKPVHFAYDGAHNYQINENHANEAEL